MYNTPDSSKIEPRFKDSIDRYVKDKIPIGGFLRAVLENDLKGAIGSADLDAMDNIRHILCYCWNEIPSNCWGNKDKVKSWLESRKETA
jgi:hypothetical protein